MKPVCSQIQLVARQFVSSDPGLSATRILGFVSVLAHPLSSKFSPVPGKYRRAAYSHWRMENLVLAAFSL